VTEQQQQQHTSNKLTNKQTNNPYGNPTTRYCETFAGRKEGRKCWQSAHYLARGTSRAPKARSILNTSDG